jgi:hypothetical protein
MNRLASAHFVYVVSTFLLLGTGCASRPKPALESAASPPQPVALHQTADLLPLPPSDAIVAIHKSKCGSCHTRVEPGSMARTTAESAMSRHRRRAKLTEQQWEEMIDLLSDDHLAHARPTAQNP